MGLLLIRVRCLYLKYLDSSTRSPLPHRKPSIEYCPTDIEMAIVLDDAAYPVRDPCHLGMVRTVLPIIPKGGDWQDLSYQAHDSFWPSSLAKRIKLKRMVDGLC